MMSQQEGVYCDLRKNKTTTLFLVAMFGRIDCERMLKNSMKAAMMVMMMLIKAENRNDNSQTQTNEKKKLFTRYGLCVTSPNELVHVM
jgi:hypothetical protein